MSNTSWFIGGISFESACREVQEELQVADLWCSRLEQVKVRQVPLGLPYGWQYYQGCGDIVIPRLSLVRLFDLARGVVVPLRDTLRHEYAHAFAQINSGFYACDRFVSAFGKPHDSPRGCLIIKIHICLCMLRTTPAKILRKRLCVT